MVKSVLGEETQLKLVEDRLSQSRITSEVGLIIGKLSSTLDRGFVFDLIPTPRNDAGDPACSLIDDTARDNEKKGLKGKSQSHSSCLVIDYDWVAEHARQVSRMLLGGMSVVGLYIWVSDCSFKSSTLTLCQAVKGVGEGACSYGAVSDKKLLIHISYSPRRWTCRNCILTSNITSSNLCPCDFKFGTVLKSFQKFTSVYNFDLRLPIYCEATSECKTLSDFLHNMISCLAKELAGAKTLIGGNFVFESDSCSSVSSREVSFLIPFMSDISVEACSQKNVVGVLAFRGSLSSFSYAHSKEKLSKAIADLKGDIIKSLQTRLDIIFEADEDGSSNNEMSTENSTPHLVLGKACSLSFPRRVLVPWLEGTYICDYLQPNESLQVVKEHCAEVMSMEGGSEVSKMVEPETEGSSILKSSFWDIVEPDSECLRSAPKSGSMLPLPAIFGLILSMLAAWLLVFINY